MNSPYIAIDIETTGIDHERHQVLEIAAVYNNMSLDVMECPTFEALIDPGEIDGEPYALALNVRLLKRIADGEGDHPHAVMDGLMDWVFRLSSQTGVKQFHLLGKNVGKFDYHFLKRMPGWEERYFSHRHLEVGSLFSTPEGIDSQSQLFADLAKDANITGDPHEALYDARVSLELARRYWHVTTGHHRQTYTKPEETP